MRRSFESGVLANSALGTVAQSLRLLEPAQTDAAGEADESGLSLSRNVQKCKSSGYRRPECGSWLETGFSSPTYPANCSLQFPRQSMHGLADRPFPDKWPYHRWS